MRHDVMLADRFTYYLADRQSGRQTHFASSGYECGGHGRDTRWTT
jgi:hypothetical protein